MSNLVAIFVVTVVAFGLVISLMAIGVMMGRREIKGSCGGLGSGQGEAGSASCSICSNSDAACRELGGEQESGQEALGAEDAEDADCDHRCQAKGCSEEKIRACNP